MTKPPKPPIILRQGDTQTVVMELSQPIDGCDLKFGFYTPQGKPLFETHLSDGMMQVVDSTHLTLELPHDVTRRLHGITTARCVVFTADHSMVNAGENAVPVMWEPEPSTRNLK